MRVDPIYPHVRGCCDGIVYESNYSNLQEKCQSISLCYPGMA
jgi:hypothetical protein